MAQETAAYETTPPAPVRAVMSVILSMGLVAMASGMLYTFIPIRLTEAGFAPSTSGWLVTAMGAGNFIGCFVGGAVVRRVGHARAFCVFAAACTLSTLSLSIAVDPLLWAPARLINGVGMIGLFVVSQSWLNDATENHQRGRVLAAFYIVFIASMGLGSEFLRHIDLSGRAVYLIGAACGTLSLIPVGLTKLPPPPPPERIQLAFRRLWQVSPVGFVGVMAAGAMSVTIQGLIPLYLANIGFAAAATAFLVSRMQVGNIALQWPLGWLSDRIDRRWALIVSGGLALVASMGALALGAGALWAMLAVCAVWIGATESIYAISTAQINDRADPREFVAMSSTALFLWSLGSVTGPTVASAAMDRFGAEALFYIIFAVLLFLVAFILYRLQVRERTAPEDTEPYVAMSPSAPVTAEFPPVPEEEWDVPGEDTVETPKADSK